MSVRSVKRWQWALAGLALGLVVAIAQLLARADEPVGGAGFVSRQLFETTIHAEPVGGRPVVTSIVIRPMAHVDLVTFQLLDVSGRNYVEAKFAAARPYTPLGQALPPNPPISVRDYLLTLSATNPALGPSYAWWEEPRFFIAIRMMIGAVLIGAIWPLIVRVLIGPPIKEGVDFSGVKDVHLPSDAARRGELSDEERKHLEELEAEMMAGLATPGDASAATVADKLPRLARQLSSETMTEAPPVAEDDKDYVGEFYPVEKKAPHDEK